MKTILLLVVLGFAPLIQGCVPPPTYGGPPGYPGYPGYYGNGPHPDGHMLGLGILGGALLRGGPHP